LGVENYAFDRTLLSSFLAHSHPSSLDPEAPRTAHVAGVDEAGRGPLAGPVVAAAVILKPELLLPGLRDSKVLSHSQRESLFPLIHSHAHAVAVSVVPHDIIDRVNILQATLQAMRDCVGQLGLTPTLVLVDGNRAPGSGVTERTVVKGDALSASIMAASIIAKVTRDRLMMEAHEQFPQYGFDEHKGYGSKKHLDALMKHGPCPIHRRSFQPLRNWLSRSPQLVNS
jgi:ribonuclease HII